MFHIHLGDFFCRDRRHAGKEGGGSGIFKVYNSEYRILSIAFWELSDEIHGYHLEGSGIWRGWDVVE